MFMSEGEVKPESILILQIVPDLKLGDDLSMNCRVLRNLQVR